jgi:hypothetical protein
MTKNILQKFQAQSNFKVPMDLADKWEWSARANGPKEIKTQIASARRTASVLKKTADQFSNVKPEHRLAFDAAINSLGALVAELTPLIPWSISFKKFCDQVRAEQDATNLEAIAMARWPDEKAFNFELAIMGELSTREGADAFSEWIHSTGRYPQSHKFVCVFQRMAEGATDRLRAARTIFENNSSAGHAWGETQFTSWRDYEAYLVFRGAVANAADRVVQGAASIQIQHNSGTI